METLIMELAKNQTLSREDLIRLLTQGDETHGRLLAKLAAETCVAHYGVAIYTRGLIEFTNHCQNNCYYCGIRRGADHCQRYRLTPEDVLTCCQEGYALGFRTFVLQGGEDPYFNDDRLVAMVAAIHRDFPTCAITLSVGERSTASYKRLFDAGADRYLLRHETANPDHYHSLHPKAMDPDRRKACLCALKAIGYQVGTGFMVGSPGQTPQLLAEDLLYIKDLAPQMIGIGPFIPHWDTPFAQEAAGTLSQTLLCLAILRLMNPKALIPATTALGTIAPDGREQGILAGANVVMPNLSPLSVRKKYSLYDGKICTGDEAAECRACLGKRMESIGRELVIHRGDSLVTP